jgi:hypothetical protein
MATILPQRLLWLLPVLLAALFAAPCAQAGWQRQIDAAYAAPNNSVQPLKQADQGTRRPRHTASLEEFFEIDDDAEQYVKAPPVLARRPAGFTLIVEPALRPYRAPPLSHQPCAAYPTGPPPSA